MPLFDGKFDHFLTVDQLRALGVVPKLFLGFVQIKLNDDQRMHVWHPDINEHSFEEELHDHRYEFTSHVLAGETTHEEYFFVRAENGDHEMVEVSCKPGVPSDPAPLGRGFVQKGGSYTMVAGSKYTFPPTGFHRIRTQRCVTLLERGEIVTDFARVIKLVDAPSVCPFERQLPVNQLWEIVVDVLEDGRTVRNPGYHVTPIEKGVLGQSSKILEEVLELMDAERQGSKIMAQVELADLFGAYKAYIASNYPERTIEDFTSFSAITERAFNSGRRG